MDDLEFDLDLDGGDGYESDLEISERWHAEPPARLKKPWAYNNLPTLNRWRPEEDAILLKHYNRTLTARQIGARIGRSRLGVIHRFRKLCPHAVIRMYRQTPSLPRLQYMESDIGGH